MPQSEFWPFKSKLKEDANVGEASVLQKQLGDMEGEVKEIQMQLAALRNNRHGARKINLETINTEEDVKHIPDEKNFKLTEFSKLREDLIRAKNAADGERLQKEKYETILKDMEGKLSGLCCTGLISVPEVKDLQKCSDSEINSLKNQVRDLKDQLEETRLTLTDKSDELQEYRLKYLQAQQQVEELRRQLETQDYDNKQVSEQVQLEIQKMKMQFQEKLLELAPLPDLLKGAQIELQEAKQLQKLAEDSSQQFSNELQRVKEKLVVAVNCLNKERAERLRNSDQLKTLQLNWDDKQKECEELTVNLENHKYSVLRLQEKLTQQENRFKEKSIECAELLKDLDEVRQESDRSINRSKERADSMRRYLQTQIAELERQLVQSRAQCRACQKDRDEVRQLMQIQINNLRESFEMVEMRLRGLQGQVNSLKNTYAIVLAGEGEQKFEINNVTN